MSKHKKKHKPKRRKIRIKYALYSITIATSLTAIIYIGGFHKPVELMVCLVLSYLTALSYYMEKKK